MPNRPPPGHYFDHATGQWVPFAPGQGWTSTSPTLTRGGGSNPGGITIGTGIGEGSLPGTGPTFGTGGLPPIFRQPTLTNPAGPTPTTPTPTPETPATDKKKGTTWQDIIKQILTGQGQTGTGPGGMTIPAIAALARILGGLSTGRAAGRLSEAEQARLYDYLNLARTRTMYDRSGAELDQRKFAQDLQERSFKNANKAGLLSAARPGPGITIPSELSAFQGQGRPGLGDIPQGQRDETANAMYRNAITELLDPLQPGTATSGRRMAALPEPDPISPTPEANGFDDFLNWASIIGGGLFPPRTTTTTTTTPTTTTPTTTPTPPPPVVPPRRSPDQLNPDPLQPRTGLGDFQAPTSRAPSIGDLSTPSSASPYGPSSPVNLQAQGLTTSLAGMGSGLPSITGLVPDVPDPTSPLSDPWDRLRGRRLT